MMRRGAFIFAALGVCGLCLLIASCGGSSSSAGNGGSGGNGNGQSTISQQLAKCTADLPALSVPTSGNSVQVIVDNGPCAYGVPPNSAAGTQPSVFVLGSANLAFTSVTVCTPGSTSACQVIDHVMVDTGSSGLRIMSSVLSSAVALPGVSIGGAALLECIPFADGYSWGSVRYADVYIAGEAAGNIPLQVIGDSESSIPSDCSGSSPNKLDDVISFGANGVLGVGLFPQDCGLACDPSQQTASSGNPPFYYTCAANSACTSSPVGISLQVTNPVSVFPTDNNGVLLALPNLPSSLDTNVDAGENVYGTLYFGIGTQNNNSATPVSNYFTADSLGNFNSQLTSTSSGGYTLDNSPHSNSFIDSGSNGIFFPNPGSIPVDKTYNWFTPTSTLTIGASLQGEDSAGQPSGSLVSVTFYIANAKTLFSANSGNDTAFDALGAPNAPTSSSADGIDWGLPFFYGKNMFVGLQGKSVTIGAGPTTVIGPFWAY